MSYSKYCKRCNADLCIEEAEIGLCYDCTTIATLTKSLEEAKRFIQLVANDNLDRVSPGMKGKAQALLSTLGGAKKGETE